MSVQTSISSFFNNRKRPAGSGALEGKRPKKVLIVEEKSAGDVSPVPVARTPHAPPRQPSKTPQQLSVDSTPPESGRSTPLRAARPVRKSLFPTLRQDNQTGGGKKVDVPVVANRQIKGLPSPMKRSGHDDDKDSVQNRQPSDSKPVLSITDSSRKELGLSDIKSRLKQSSRKNEIFRALEHLKEGHRKLKEIGDRKQLLEATKSESQETSLSAVPKSPSLQRFKSIQLDVPTSPSKAALESMRELKSPSKLRGLVFKSPTKLAKMGAYVSPRKLLEEKAQLSPMKSPLKLPAYQQYQSLVLAGKPALPLPYKYRLLAEIFRSVDTTVSIMYNRGEGATFPKLSQSVQRLSNKNLTEAHLGQIASVLPGAFKFAQEKVHQFGQSDKYHLVITPLFAADKQPQPTESKSTHDDGGTSKKASGGDRELMTPSVLLERKRLFYEALLDMTKDHHETMLKSLDPPLVINRNELMRWHPDFDIESCPNIEPTPLPRPPNAEKYSTARDVLNKARDMFVLNPRMEKALERLSELQTEKSGAQPEEQQEQPATAANAAASLAAALKGIPKSLLEKVRARQAAKAMSLLVQNPEESKLSMELGRLPELARLVRNIYVTEKRSILPYKSVITRMCSSYREILSPADMEHHLELLLSHVPNWLIAVGKKDHLKMVKEIQMADVMTKLQNLANSNSVH